MKRCCKAESIDVAATCKTIIREYIKRCCEAESIDAAATCKKINRENMKRHHMAESYEQLQHKIAIEIHQKRENSKVGSIMVAQFATTRK
jgi:hypothetical protein